MDPVLHTFKKIRWAPLVQVSILTIGTLISFIMSYGNGNVTIYLPFISETGSKVPSMCIFTLTLILGSITGAVAVCYRNLILRYLLSNKEQRLLLLNDISAIFGLFSMAGLAGVAAFPESTVFWAHLLAAGLHFFFSVLYVLLQTFLSHFVPDAIVLVTRLRLLLCLGMLLFASLLTVLFPLSLTKWHKVNPGPPALKTPQDEVFGLVITSAFCEWSTCILVFIYFLTFVVEFRKYHLTIGVVPVSTKNNSDP